MKFIKTIIVLLIGISSVACQNLEFEKTYAKDILTLDDCKNTDFAAWILKKETGLDLTHKELKLATTEYFGGVPVQIRQFPIYYEVVIYEQEYNEYRQRFSNEIWGWEYFQNSKSINFVLANKRELSCAIEKDKITFGLRNVSIIAP
jgi:hypothetical protein